MAIPERVVGEGPVKVLALHGWFGSAAGWGYLPGLIDTERYSYAFLDNRGYGDRRTESGDYSLAEVSADARELVGQLGWDRYALLGHSMGGAVAARIWADAPEAVTALVGVSPVPASGVPFDEQGWNLFNGAAQQDGNRYAIIDFTTGNRQSSTWLNQMVAFSVAESTREAFGGYLPSWAHASFVDELPEPSIPVTVIVGEHDPALGADTMKATWLAQLPDARLEVLANAGHYAMFEAPVALITQIERALGDVPTEDSAAPN